MSTKQIDLPRAITLRMPMGDLIVSGIKTLENRKRKLPGVREGDWIFIHQTSTVFCGSWPKLKKWDRVTRYLDDEWTSATAFAFTQGIIGIAKVEAILMPDDIDIHLDGRHKRWYMPGCVAYVLGSALRLPKPKPHKGQLGAWYVRDEGLLELRDELAVGMVV